MPKDNVILQKAFKIACKELADTNGCPSEILHPDFEYKGSCAKNSFDGIDEADCWEDFIIKKAKEAINAEEK